MKECDILRRSEHTLTLPTFFFLEPQNLPTPRIYAPGEPPKL